MFTHLLATCRLFVTKHNTFVVRKELITSVVAGKSFSLATNVQGQMFAWGRGWSGQLGLGVAEDTRVRRVKYEE